ncbi:hypothetical protein TRFO_08589 [Tritrichomonas foetus]|uniref:Protein kinase domain-containing protein n=1 Tax=Tritrichomonas foetus TaxID=1144522 RepID=A0A1J4JP40_9EUKA|nr:hypothetical protein TRFO_08589 [Tritrichomonas foetus]|eukprot:OHS99036.1 hypothetical protein TRFO_08589 [Tritrichomonas foetus]
MTLYFVDDTKFTGLQQFIFHETRYSLCHIYEDPESKTLQTFEQIEDPPHNFIVHHPEKMIDFSHPCISLTFELNKETAERTCDFYFGGSLEDIRSSFYENISMYDHAHRYIIAYGVAKALQYLHSLEIIHKDVRPENILLDQNLYPYLNVYPTDEKVFKLGYVSYPYISPEAYNDRKATDKSDVWMLGSLIFELFAEEKPYQEMFALDFSDIKDCRTIIENVIRKGNRTHFPDERETQEWENEANNFPRKHKINYRQGISPFNEVKKGHKMRELIEQCFNLDPKQRPTAEYIANQIESIGKEELKNNSDQFNTFVTYLDYVKPKIEKGEKPERQGTYDNLDLAIERNLPFAYLIKSVLLYYHHENDPKDEMKPIYGEIKGLLMNASDFGFEDAYTCLIDQFEDEEEVDIKYKKGFFKEILI